MGGNTKAQSGDGVSGRSARRARDQAYGFQASIFRRNTIPSKPLAKGGSRLCESRPRFG